MQYNNYKNMSNHLKLVFLLLNLIITFNSCAESVTPWFTGPILAAAGRTVPLGNVNFELYAFYTDTFAAFDNNWNRFDITDIHTGQINPILTYGLADNFDVQLNLPYAQNRTEGINNRHLGDVAVNLGMQLFRQDKNQFTDLRLTLQQIFPTGRFEDLNPTNEGTDGTGVGSYQTSIGLNFQHLFLFGNYHYRQRFTLNYVVAQPVHIRGVSVYGSNDQTHGTIKPGNLTGIDIAGELEVSRHWVLVMEAFYFYRTPLAFEGFAGFDDNGNLLDLTQGRIAAITIAPAIEYNFSAHYGIIAGVWLPIRGKNFSDFLSSVVAFNAFW